MTTSELTLQRIERLLHLRGESRLTPQEREMLEDLMETGPCADGYLVEAVSVGRYFAMERA